MRLVALPGDGIGPEIMAATLAALRAVDAAMSLSLDIRYADAGLASLQRTGSTFPDALWEEVRAADGIILGPLSTYQYPPREAGGLNPSAELRQRLRLYANIRPSVRLVEGIGGAMDLVIVRENTEGFYASRSMFAGGGEFMPDPDSAFALRKITREASRKVARVAFDLARGRRGKVTAVHKANVLKISDGLFLNAFREIAADYPDVEAEEQLVDAVAALLVRDPGRFDVLVTTNMFGDILSNEAAELAGGLGMAPSLNAGDSIAMAQASHGSAPDIAGRDLANPTGLMLSTGMLLDWLARRFSRPEVAAAAASLRRAIDRALENPATRTADLKGTVGTGEFGRIVAGFAGAG